MIATISAFQELQVFVVVVQSGSFTAAARKLDLPKSSVSRRVSSLEDRLGLRLLHRTTRSLNLTEAGEVYFEKAARIVTELIDLESLVSGYTEAPVGSLRITCPTGFAGLNAEFFNQFLVDFPDVQLQLHETDSFVDLVKDGFDIAFRGGRAPEPSLTGVKLTSCETWLVASKAYLQKYSPLFRLQDLQEHETILLGARSRGGFFLTNGRQENEVELQGRVRVNSLRCAQQFVLEGHGIGLLPRASCLEALESEELERVLPSWCGRRAELWIVYPTERQMASAVRAFLEMAKSWDFEIL